MTDKFITVVIPAKNESKVIKHAILRVLEAFEKYWVKWECLIIDNSTDWWKTKEEALKRWARVVSTEPRWLWNAYIFSVPHIKGDYVIMGDADSTYDFMEMDWFIKKLDEGYDFVMGTRLKWNIHKWAMPRKNRYIGTPLLTFFINLFYKAGISDCNSWLRALTKDAFERMELESLWWEYASEMVVKAKLLNLKMCEIPVSLLPDREWRVPHLQAYKAWYQNMKYIFLLASDAVFIKIWTFLSIIGLIILISQIFWPIEISWVTFGTYYIFLWIILFSIWMSAIQMWILTQSFSYLKKFKISKLTQYINKQFDFEKNIGLSVLLFLLWFLIELYVFINRIKTWNIDVLSFKLWLYALFFITISLQLIYFSFIYYLFNKNK